MAKIYYVGDWAILTGPVFAETPFQFSPKGLEVFNYGLWLKEALESSGEHQVESVPTWDFYKLGPGEFEKILDEYDVFIFSDFEGKLFQLAPDFFDRKKFGKGVLTFPDRAKLVVQAIKAGKKAMFLGGWYSFTGELGKGGWGRTPIKEVLPVQCLPTEDLVESTEGYYPEVTKKGKKYLKQLDFSTIPPILGYNETIPLKGSKVLMTYKETGHPMLVTKKIGKGKVLAYTSDPAPHWAANFVYWEHYNAFWLACLALLIKPKK
jgi:uncharacterized membrane protein